MHIFEKRGSFLVAQAKNMGPLRAAQAEKWGLLGGTYPYCPDMGVPAPGKMYQKNNRHGFPAKIAHFQPTF